MARLRLSTGIFSPVQSDISLNDASAFSFSSLTSTPEFEKETESCQNKHTREGLEFNTCHNNSTAESATEFELVMRDFKKDVNINAKKEEKFRNTYEQLKHSFDELFPKKVQGVSILSPISNSDYENIGNTKDFDLKTEKIKDNVQHAQKRETFFFPTTEPQYWPQAASPKVEKSSLAGNSTDKEKYCQPKSLSKKTGSEIKLGNELNSRKEDGSPKCHRTKSFKIRTTSTQTCESFFQAASTKSVADKSQNIIPTGKAKSSSNEQNFENKGMSIEKSIQLAVGIELDKIRSLMLDQKLSLGKEMLKLQEMTRKQSEVVHSLLTVIEELLEENQKLRATHK